MISNRTGACFSRVASAAAYVRDLAHPWAGRAGGRDSTGAIIIGLAAASLGVLVTITLAGGGHAAAGPPPVAATPPTGASHVTGAAGILPLRRPRPVYHPPAAAKPNNPVSAIAPVVHRSKARTSLPDSGTLAHRISNSGNPTHGISDAQRIAEQFGAPAWALNILSP